MSGPTTTTKVPEAGTPGRTATRRPMRNQRMVTLRSAMPVELMTLRHSVPAVWGGEVELETTPKTRTTTPKVDPARRAVETTVRKGGDAR